MLKYRRLFLLLACILFITNNMQAQNDAQISSDELVYNFGNIEEADGLANHLFSIKNTGNGPLVITRITASCGCTQPEWSKAPIAPGKTGEVKVTYNPKGRPGPFYKTITIYSNGKKGSFSLGIKGNVIPKPTTPTFIYPYAIGDLKLSKKSVLFNSIRAEETQGEKINIINEGKTTLTLQLGKTPHYLTVNAPTTPIAPGEIGEITLLMNAKEAKKKGRVEYDIPVIIKGVGQKEKEDKLHIAANIIDNFSKLSASDKVKAPVAQLSGTLLDFGKLPAKGSIIPLLGSKISGTIDITNSGKSPLIIYSFTSDNPQIDISGGKREIKPGATATFKVTLHPKEIKIKLEALINIVCNDPNGPVRLVKVTAEK